MSNEVSCDSVARRVNGENPLDVLVGVSTSYGPLLTDDYGRPIRFAEYGDGPCRFGDRPIQVMKPYEWLADRVYVFDDEAVAPFKDDVARFVVEACRCFVGGDAEYQFSAVVCRPGVAERLDLRSEAFAPMLPDDRDPFDDGCMLGESLSYLCGMDPARPGAVYERLGYAKGWLDEGRAYQTVLSPYAYVRRPDRSIVVSDDCWDALIEVFDVPDEQALDCLCLAIRCGGAWPVDGEGGGAMV